MSEPKYLTVDHLTTSDISRIFSKIAINQVTECWEWQGKLSHKGKGYGCVWFRGKEERAHRLLYAWLVGPVPIGISAEIPQLDHEVCDNKRCCNPAHLILKLSRENVLRCDNAPAAINSKKTHCPQGHEFSFVNTPGQKRRRVCGTCHNERRIARLSTPDGHQKAFEYQRAYRDRPGNREKYRDASRRHRERLKLRSGSD